MRQLSRNWATFAKRKHINTAFFWYMVGIAVLWGGTKPNPPPPSVEEEGIKIVSHSVTKDGVAVEFETTDPRVTDETEFVVEFRKRPIMLGDTVVETPDDLKWRELGRTKSRKVLREIFLLDSTFEMRVRADITGSEVTE